MGLYISKKIIQLHQSAKRKEINLSGRAMGQLGNILPDVLINGRPEPRYKTLESLKNYDFYPELLQLMQIKNFQTQ